jgi:hypothetical protein
VEGVTIAGEIPHCPQAEVKIPLSNHKKFAISQFYMNVRYHQSGGFEKYYNMRTFPKEEGKAK